MAAKFENHFREVERAIEREASALVKKTALEIERDIKADMAAPKHGRTYGHSITRDSKGRYVKRGTSVSHQASAPGEAPAVDTGALVNSVQMEMDGPLAAEVGTPQEYAAPLERGTTEIEPRPAWERAGTKAKNVFQRNASRIR